MLNIINFWPIQEDCGDRTRETNILAVSFISLPLSLHTPHGCFVPSQSANSFWTRRALSAKSIKSDYICPFAMRIYLDLTICFVLQSLVLDNNFQAAANCLESKDVATKLFTNIQFFYGHHPCSRRLGKTSNQGKCVQKGRYVGLCDQSPANPIYVTGI